MSFISFVTVNFHNSITYWIFDYEILNTKFRKAHFSVAVFKQNLFYNLQSFAGAFPLLQFYSHHSIQLSLLWHSIIRLNWAIFVYIDCSKFTVNKLLSNWYDSLILKQHKKRISIEKWLVESKSFFFRMEKQSNSSQFKHNSYSYVSIECFP